MSLIEIEWSGGDLNSGRRRFSFSVRNEFDEQGCEVALGERDAFVATVDQRAFVHVGHREFAPREIRVR